MIPSSVPFCRRPRRRRAVLHASPSLDLSVLIPADRDGREIAALLPPLRTLLDDLAISSEIVVLSWRGDRSVQDAAAASGAEALHVAGGYGDALRSGFERARGRFVLTMDADVTDGPGWSGGSGGTASSPTSPSRRATSTAAERRWGRCAMC